MADDDKPRTLATRIKQAPENQPATEGSERTPGAIEVPTPKRDDFFGNLDKVAKPEKSK